MGGEPGDSVWAHDANLRETTLPHRAGLLRVGRYSVAQKPLPESLFDVAQNGPDSVPASARGDRQ